MRTLSTLALAAAAIAAAATMSTAPASAGIYCDGPYQIVDGAPIATPYCEDNYLARVARSYGMRVSSRAVRWNPSVKAEACRLVGHDNRVSTICAGENPFYRHRGGRH